MCVTVFAFFTYLLKKFEELIRGRYLHFQVINDQAKPGKPGHRNK